MSKKKRTTVIVDLPILTISSGSGLVLKKGGQLIAGGHFYSTQSSLFAKNDASIPYVFVHVECDLTLEASVTVGTGASVAVSRSRVTGGGDVTILALVHPMYHTTARGGTGYYLPKRTHIEAGCTYPASNDDASAPALSVEIELIPGGVGGKLTAPMSVIADKGSHPGDAYVDLDT